MKNRPRIHRYSMLDVMMASPTASTPHADGQLLRMWAAFASIKAGDQPTTNDWRLCSDAVNLVETVVTEGLAEDAQGLLQDAVAALAKAGQRNLQGKPIRLDGEGIRAVQAILEDYEALLGALSHRQMMMVHRKTEKRIWDILDGKRLPHDVEVVSV